jgi:putative salt-induced outer membrane protein YdiY
MRLIGSWKFWLGFALVLGLVHQLYADTVELKGGDHLTGTVLKLEEGKLHFKTAYAADAIVIDFAQVVKLTVVKPLILTTAKTRLAVTGLTAEGKTVQALTGSTATQLAAAEVKALRNEADQKTWEKTQHPNWDHGWVINANMSFAVAQGNAQSESIGAGSSAVRATHNDKTTVNFSTLYGRDNKASVTTSDSTGGNVRYDRNVNPRLFVYGASDFLTNGLQNLDLRTILSSGFGWHAAKQKQQTLDIFGGGAWTREHYSTTTTATASTNSFAAVDVGESWNRKLGKPSALTEQATFYPNMNQLGDYQIQLAGGLTSKLTKLLNWHVNVTDNYTSFPPAGSRANDMVVTTGIGVTFAKP